MEYITLNNQVTMPILGLGTYQLKGESGIETIKNAINLGYTLIDTAQMYQNEIEVGIAINKVMLIGKIYLSQQKYVHQTPHMKRLKRQLIFL